jgi:hypothetical protein
MSLAILDKTKRQKTKTTMSLHKQTVLKTGSGWRVLSVPGTSINQESQPIIM